MDLRSALSTPGTDRWLLALDARGGADQGARAWGWAFGSLGVAGTLAVVCAVLFARLKSTSGGATTAPPDTPRRDSASRILHEL